MQCNVFQIFWIKVFGFINKYDEFFMLKFRLLYQQNIRSFEIESNWIVHTNYKYLNLDVLKKK